MSPIADYYNKTVSLFRVTNPEPTEDMWEVGGDQYVMVLRNVSCRIASGVINEQFRQGAFKEEGIGSGYKNKLFVPAGTDIKVGDRVIDTADTNNRFYVDYVNKIPGGLSDHHIECIITASDFMVAS